MDKQIAGTKQRHVLIVDDEPGIVNAVRRELMLPSIGPYSLVVETFTDPHEALRRAAEQEFDAVVVDYRMPGIDGLAFMRLLAPIQPDCIPIVLSGHTDVGALIKMINESHIYRFIPKPWSTYFLKSSIIQAIHFHDELVQNRRLAADLRAGGILLSENTPPTGNSILIIDPSVNVSTSVARTLSRPGGLDNALQEVMHEVERYTEVRSLPKIDNVDIANTPAQALQLANKSTYSCIVADFGAPELASPKFWEDSVDKQVDCTFIALTKGTQMETLINAMDVAHIYAFVEKPWTDFDLCSAVAQALVSRQIRIQNRSLAQKMKQVQ